MKFENTATYDVWSVMRFLNAKKFVWRNFTGRLLNCMLTV